MKSETPVTGELRDMHAHLEKTPDDLTAYGAVADMLEELGYAKLPHAYRWCMSRDLYPHKRLNYPTPNNFLGVGRKVPAKFRWAWYVRDAYTTWIDMRPAHAKIPPIIIGADQKVFPLHAAAMDALAGWLHELKKVYELNPKEAAL